MNKSTQWLVLYIIFLVVVTFGIYIGIHIFFKEPFTDPVFSSIHVLQTSTQKDKQTEQDKAITVRPTMSPPKISEKQQLFVKRFDDNPEYPVYFVRMYTTNQIVLADNALHGQCTLVNDLKGQILQFSVRGKNQHFAVGIHYGGFQNYPNKYESYTIRDIQRLIPPRTFVQLHITTRDYSLEERVRLQSLLESDSNSTQSGSIDLRAFTIEIIQ
jgi:hypothetical protein